MSPADAKKGLGRGLSALLGDTAAQAAAPAEGPRAARLVQVSKIHPGRYQPRRHFEPQAMADLVASVKTQGVLQPILVRRDPKHPGDYELVAGERRWRAAQAALLHEIPAVVKDLTDREALEAALVENLQREDLNAIEEALGYKRLQEEMGFAPDAIAKAVGKDRSTIVNMLRLLSLPESARQLIETGKLTAAHGRVALAAPDPESFAAIMALDGLTVRQAEARLKAMADPATAKTKLKRPPKGVTRDADTRAIEKRLTESLGLKVELRPRKNGAGELVLHYSNLDQFDDLLARLDKDGG
jgi:ParB family transcriptional regulator, chromosome partitioning protein